MVFPKKQLPSVPNTSSGAVRSRGDDDSEEPESVRFLAYTKWLSEETQELDEALLDTILDFVNFPNESRMQFKSYVASADELNLLDREDLDTIFCGCRLEKTKMLLLSSKLSHVNAFISNGGDLSKKPTFVAIKRFNEYARAYFEADVRRPAPAAATPSPSTPRTATVATSDDVSDTKLSEASTKAKWDGEVDSYPLGKKDTENNFEVKRSSVRRGSRNGRRSRGSSTSGTKKGKKARREAEESPFAPVPQTIGESLGTNSKHGFDEDDGMSGAGGRVGAKRMLHQDLKRMPETEKEEVDEDDGEEEEEEEEEEDGRKRGSFGTGKRFDRRGVVGEVEVVEKVYASLSAANVRGQKEDILQERVKSFVKTKLFKAVKWLPEDFANVPRAQELIKRVKEAFGTYLMLRENGEEWVRRIEEIWVKEGAGRLIRTQLGTKRNTVRGEVKRNLLTVWKLAEDKRPIHYIDPTDDNLEDLLTCGRSKYNTFCFFAEQVLARVVGVNFWKRGHRGLNRVSDMVSLSDEQLAYMVLESVWPEVVEEVGGITEAVGPGYIDARTGSRPGGSLSADGLARYEELRDYVEKDRADNGDTFESAYRREREERLGDEPAHKTTGRTLAAINTMAMRHDPLLDTL